MNRSNKQTRSRHKRGLAGRGIFRDYINEYLFPDAEVKPNSGLIFSLILAIVAVPLLLSTARALPEIRAGQAPPSSPQPGKNHISFLDCKKIFEPTVYQWNNIKVEKILKGSLGWILSPSPTQISLIFSSS